MEAARAYSAEIHPVYGRSIWDASLGSYSYDTYETWQEDLYLWMSHLETTGETEYLRTDENTTTEAGGRKIDFAATTFYCRRTCRRMYRRNCKRLRTADCGPLAYIS